jgi:hypothetical protein
VSSGSPVADVARYERAVAAIDAANADDPNRILVRGVERPKEQAHAELMTEWVERLSADTGDPPSEALLLAARAHHLRRWALPRSDYPDGRKGYLRWRRDLHQRHAADVSAILHDEGYEEDTVARVADIVRKRNLERDPEVQVLEDALCLVFVETQFRELADRLDHGKMVDVVRKTLVKMSDEGKQQALALDLPVEDRALIEEALRG